MTTLPDLARAIATAAHTGQVDKSGQDYITHPARVASHAQAAGGDQTVLAAAWLHDVLEDTPVTADDLAAAGIPTDVIAAVQALTHQPGEPRTTYYDRVAANPVALAVKAADLADNTDPVRMAALDGPTAARLAAKYTAAHTHLGLPVPAHLATYLPPARP